jgi:hypothetical protein
MNGDKYHEKGIKERHLNIQPSDYKRSILWWTIVHQQTSEFIMGKKSNITNTVVVSEKCSIFVKGGFLSNEEKREACRHGDYFCWCGDY